MTVAHIGYLDGLHGRDPDSRLEGSRDYDTGWLHGAQDREDLFEIPKYHGPVDVPLKRGDTVTIPKGAFVRHLSRGAYRAGSTYKIKVHYIFRGTPAYVDHQGLFVRPKVPLVCWGGSGGYWNYADVNEIVFDDEPG